MIQPVFKISFIMVLLFLTSGVSAQINFATGDWDTVLEEARNSGKGIFVEFYTVWCGPCKQLDKTTFRDEEVGLKFNQQFVNYKIDAESSHGLEIARSFEVKAYPTMIFLDPNGVLLFTSRGYKKPNDLLHIADLVKTLPSHKKLVSVLHKIEPTKDQLKYLITHGREFHTANKAKYLKRLFRLLSEKEKQDREWQKLFLFQYTSIDDEDLKDDLIDIYNIPSAYEEMQDDDIRLHYNLGQDLINETKQAKRGSNHSDYKRIAKRKINFQHKLNKISAKDTAFVLMEHDLLYYGFNKELDQYERVAVPFMENYLLDKLKSRKHIGIRKGDTHQVLFLSICDHLKTYYNKDKKKSNRIIGWLDEIIDQTGLLEAYIYKARVYKQLGENQNMRNVIDEALKKPINPQQRDRLNAMLD